MSEQIWQLYVGQFQDARRVNRLHHGNWECCADQNHCSLVSGRDELVFVGSDEADAGKECSNVSSRNRRVRS